MSSSPSPSQFKAVSTCYSNGLSMNTQVELTFNSVILGHKAHCFVVRPEIKPKEYCSWEGLPVKVSIESPLSWAVSSTLH